MDQSSCCFRIVHDKHGNSHPPRQLIVNLSNPSLQNFSHDINPKQTVALVGQSGCGKSTIIQLLQRFYDPSDHGHASGIFFDGMNIRQLAPHWIRQQIGIVSQEPTLFNISVKDNIAYGDNTRDVPMHEIIEAARRANIHDFISSLPQVSRLLVDNGDSNRKHSIDALKTVYG